MKKIKLLIAVFFLLGLGDAAMSQTNESTSEKKTWRKERKEWKKENLKRKYEKLVELAEEKSLILEAHTISHSNGRNWIAPPENFMKIDGDKFTYQSSTIAGFGRNGIGGVTDTGIIRKYEILKNKKGLVSIRAQIVSNILGELILTMNIGTSGSGFAILTNTWGRRTLFTGPLTDLDEVNLYHGINDLGN